jgi:hypothetical protein
LASLVAFLGLSFFSLVFDILLVTASFFALFIFEVALFGAVALVGRSLPNGRGLYLSLWIILHLKAGLQVSLTIKMIRQ